MTAKGEAWRKVNEALDDLWGALARREPVADKDDVLRKAIRAYGRACAAQARGGPQHG